MDHELLTIDAHERRAHPGQGRMALTRVASGEETMVSGCALMKPFPRGADKLRCCHAAFTAGDRAVRGRVITSFRGTRKHARFAVYFLNATQAPPVVLRQSWIIPIGRRIDELSTSDVPDCHWLLNVRLTHGPSGLRPRFRSTCALRNPAIFAYPRAPGKMT